MQLMIYLKEDKKNKDSKHEEEVEDGDQLQANQW
jgi:hypothetical protein